MERRIFKDRSLQGITQGSILTGIELQRYSRYPVWGLVITPRCDLARGISVETVHILPIVDIDAWFDVEGKFLLIEKTRSKLKEKINKKASPYFGSGDIFESGFNIDELKELFNEIEDAQIRNLLINWISSLEKNDDAMISESANSDSINSLIENLFGDKEKRFYLIEDWMQPNKTKIILLREILSIRRHIALKYRNGFTERECLKEDLQTNNLRITDDQSLDYQIKKEILSPYIEHIMQRFAYNFTRIGVTDRTSSLIAQIKQNLRESHE